MSQDIFERELGRRADAVHGAPLSFEDVRGKARSIQRRRRGAVAGAVAAAVALVAIVPTVLSGGDAPGSDAPEPAPSPGTPGASVLHDGTLTTPDGERVSIDLDNEDVLQLGVLTDGRIVAATQEPYAVLVYAPDGSLQEQHDVAVNLIRMSTAHDAVAWIGDDRGVRVLSSGEAEPAVLPGIPAAGEFTGMVDAVLGPETVLADGTGYTDTVVTPDGAEPLDASEIFRVRDVSPDGSLWAVDLDPAASNVQFGCAALYDPESDEIVAESCETSFLEFSPDGQHLVGWRGDNAMIGDAKILDLDLQVVGQWAPETNGEVLKSLAWDDASHLLLSESNWQDNSWALTRVDLAWSGREVLDGPVEGGNPEVVNEYILSE